MKTSCLLLGLICGFCASGPAQTTLTGTESELTDSLPKVPRVVFVGGEAEVKVQADRAVVRLKVSTPGKGLELAMQANQQARTKLVEFLGGQGIAAGRVQISRFSSTPKYGMLTDKVKSYRVDHLIKVTVESEEQFQAVARAVDTQPALEYLGVDLQHSNEEKLKADAIGRACANADARKRVLEEQLGLKLTARAVADPATPTAPLVIARGDQAGRAQSGPASSTVSGVLTDPSFYVVTRALVHREPDEIGFGELSYQARVRVEYAAEPARK